MRKQFLAALGVCAVLLSGGLAWAGDEVVAKVPFAFIVDGTKTLPAGRYDIKAEGSNQAPVTIRNLDNGKENALMVQTRLAQTGNSEPTVVFDKAEDGTYYLSEVHMPGIDGFAFQGAPGKHTHAKVTAKP